MAKDFRERDELPVRRNTALILKLGWGCGLVGSYLVKSTQRTKKKNDNEVNEVDEEGLSTLFYFVFVFCVLC